MKIIPAVLSFIITAFPVSFLDFYLAQAQTKTSRPRIDLKAAQTAFGSKNFQGAIDLLAPEIDKLNREGLILLGKAYGGNENQLAAIKTFSLILSTNPGDFEAKTLIGDQQLRQGKDREALLTYREALELNKKYEPPYLGIADIYQRRKNKYELRLLYLDMIEQLGEKPLYVSKVCQISTLDGLYDVAVQYCRKGIQLDPMNYKNPMYLGTAFKETGKTDEAMRLLKKTADSYPREAEAQITWAQILDGQKNYISSLDYYRKALRADPQSLEGHLGVAQSLFEIQKFAEALDAWKAACTLNGKVANIPLRKATNVIRLSKQSDLLKKYESAVDSCIK